MFSLSCAPCSGSNEEPPSKAVERAALTPPLIAAAVWRGKGEVCLHGRLDLNGNIHTSGPVAVDSWEATETRCRREENEADVLEDAELRSGQSQNCNGQGKRLICTHVHVAESEIVFHRGIQVFGWV